MNAEVFTNDISVHRSYCIFHIILAQQRYTQHVLHSTFSNKLAHLHVELLVWSPDPTNVKCGCTSTGSYSYTAFLFRQADECDVVEYSVTFVGVQ